MKDFLIAMLTFLGVIGMIMSYFAGSALLFVICGVIAWLLSLLLPSDEERLQELAEAEAEAENQRIAEEESIKEAEIEQAWLEHERKQSRYNKSGKRFVDR